LLPHLPLPIPSLTKPPRVSSRNRGQPRSRAYIRLSKCIMPEPRQPNTGSDRKVPRAQPSVRDHRPLLGIEPYRTREEKLFKLWRSPQGELLSSNTGLAQVQLHRRPIARLRKQLPEGSQPAPSLPRKKNPRNSPPTRTSASLLACIRAAGMLTYMRGDLRISVDTHQVNPSLEERSSWLSVSLKGRRKGRGP
jgi:hypothetical protein